MKAVAKDWGHFRAIADATAAEEGALLDVFAGMTPSQRLEAGFALLDDSPWTPQQLAQIDADADSQMELSRRRVAMGLTMGCDEAP